MSSIYYLFWLLQFCIGALVGISVRKNVVSSLAGLALALLLGTTAIVELIVVDVLPMKRPENIVLQVVATIALGFVLWGICLLFTCAGYLVSLFVSWRLGIGRGQVTIASLFAFVTIYAVVAAIGRLA